MKPRRSLGDMLRSRAVRSDGSRSLSAAIPVASCPSATEDTLVRSARRSSSMTVLSATTPPTFDPTTRRVASWCSMTVLTLAGVTTSTWPEWDERSMRRSASSDAVRVPPQSASSSGPGSARSTTAASSSAASAALSPMKSVFSSSSSDMVIALASRSKGPLTASAMSEMNRSPRG